MKRPTGIDLFSGAGGLSLGFEQAGFDIVAAVEIDPVHAAVHHFNFPNCAMIPSSVVGLGGDEIRDAAGIGDRAVDVVFGGAPCQGFSMIGQRALDDPRNSLVLEFVRIVSELKPSYFMFENVKGLTVGRHRQFLHELIDEFDRIGYGIRQPWHVLNAAYFGVPQDRHRLILMGARHGREVPAYPDSITAPSGGRANSALPLLPGSPTCRDALSDLPEAEEYEALLATDEVATNSWGTPGKYAATLRCSTADSWGLGYPRQFDETLLTSSLRTRHTEISRARFEETDPGTVEPISRFFRLRALGLSNTLRAGTDSARGAFTSPRPIHYERARCITVREMARLQGFPDWFRFHRTKWHGARQVGNAVPPPMARAIASQIVEVLGVRPKRITTPIELGSKEQLGLSMKEASDFWNVPVPVARRDRKSGAKKRKQEEIEVARLLPIERVAGA